MAVFSRVVIYAGLTISGKTYTEKGLHRPPLSADLFEDNTATAHDEWLFVTPYPSEEFSRMELPTPGRLEGSWEYDPSDTRAFRFIAVAIKPPIVNGEADRNAYVPYVFGWIDRVTLKVMKGEKRSIVVDWHPDWYLTMRSRVSFGSGRILRSPILSDARPDTSAPRRWEYTSKKDLIPSRSSRYALIEYIKNVDSSDPQKPYNQIVIAWWQIGEVITIGSDNIQTLNLDSIFAGEVEDEMGLDPDSVVGAWLCPFQPFTTSRVKSHGAVAWRESYASEYAKGTVTNLVGYAKTDDMQKTVLMDSYGSPIWTVPWGYSFRTADYIIDVGVAGASVIYHFKEDNEADYGEGNIVAVPMITIPITSNAHASYVYSGQREYDITTRKIQQQQTAVNGIANIGTSAIGGAVAGSMVAPGPGTVAGAIAGLVSSAVGTAVGYVSTGHYDRKGQEATDKLISQQAGAPIINAGGMGSFGDYLTNPGDCLIVMTRDYFSLIELTNEQSELGYMTDYFEPDCGTFRTATGGMRIEGLDVRGTSREAADYISALYARGLHID